MRGRGCGSAGGGWREAREASNAAREESGALREVSRTVYFRWGAWRAV